MRGISIRRPDKEVGAWNRYRGSGLRRSKRPSFGSAGKAGNVLPQLRERWGDGTRAGFIGFWRSMAALHRRRVGGLRERYGWKSARKSRVVWRQAMAGDIWNAELIRVKLYQQ